MQQLTPVILLVVLIIVFWFIVIRPARNQQRTQAALQRSLAVGDEVVLSAGVFGTVRALEESRVHLEIAPGTVVQVARQVVVRRVDDSGVVEGVDDAAVTAPAVPAPEAEQDAPEPAETTARSAPSDEAEAAPAKKTAAKKTATKKAPAKKTAARKTTAKKAPAKKTASTSTATGAAAGSEPDAASSTADAPDAAPGPGPETDGDHEAVTLDKSTDEAQDADRG